MNRYLSFYDYCHIMLSSRSGFIWQWYQESIMRVLDKAINSPTAEGRQSAFFLPARHAKTLIGADLFLTYMFGRCPHMSGAYATYNDEFAEMRRNEFERIVSTKGYCKLFPGTRIKTVMSKREFSTIRAKKSIKNTNFTISNAKSSTGKVVFVGRGSTLTGIPIHYGSCDDLYKNETEAVSEKIGLSIHKWFTNVWMMRLEPNAIINLFYTRWDENDVAGRLIEYQKASMHRPKYLKWNFYRFPGIKDESCENPLDTRDVGEPLDSRMVSKYEAARMDPDTFDAMIQQNPTTGSSKRLFRDIVCPRYLVLPNRFSFLIISCDTTYHEKTKNVDTCAVTILGIYDWNVYFFPTFTNKKMDFTELEVTLQHYMDTYPRHHALIVEKSANGPAIFSVMQYKAPRMSLVTVEGKSKRARAQMVFPYFSNQRLYLPDPSICPRIRELEVEMKKFTGLPGTVEKDDVLDTIFHALHYFDQNQLFNPQGPILTVRNELIEPVRGRRLISSADVGVIGAV